MVKVFTLNKNGKIELTKIELEQLLNESYWEGYMNRYSNSSWTYRSPSTIDPYTTCNTTANSITVRSTNSTTTEHGENK